MAAKKPTGGTAMTDRQKVAARKRSQPKPQSLKTKVENKVKEVKSTYDKVSKTPGIAVKGGPRTRPVRMAQPAKPKAGTTKSRGSNTAKQIGDQNQREWFNAQRDVKQKRTKSGKIIGSTVPGFKVSKSDAKSQGFDMADERKRQRSGGKGK
jgi:hypothetical protein